MVYDIGGVAATHHNLIGVARVSTDARDAQLQRDALNDAGCGRIFEEKMHGATVCNRVGALRLIKKAARNLLKPIGVRGQNLHDAVAADDRPSWTATTRTTSSSTSSTICTYSLTPYGRPPRPDPAGSMCGPTGRSGWTWDHGCGSAGLAGVRLVLTSGALLGEGASPRGPKVAPRRSRAGVGRHVFHRCERGRGFS